MTETDSRRYHCYHFIIIIIIIIIIIDAGTFVPQRDISLVFSRAIADT